MYRIRLEKRAQKALAKLPPQIQKRVSITIDGLADEPRPPGVEKMRGYTNRWRVREGNYRVLYEIHDDRLLVLVVKVGHRRDVYDR